VLLETVKRVLKTKVEMNDERYDDDEQEMYVV